MPGRHPDGKRRLGSRGILSAILEGSPFKMLTFQRIGAGRGWLGRRGTGRADFLEETAQDVSSNRVQSVRAEARMYVDIRLNIQEHCI